MESSQKRSFEHLVQFYNTEEFFLESLVEYFKVGLTAGNTCIIIATKQHRTALKEQLQLLGFDIEFAELIGNYVSLDARDTLSHFMINGMPDKNSFSQVVGSLVPHLSQQNIRAFGEMVVILWEEGNREGALALEELWNDLGKVRNFSLLCSYPVKSLNVETETEPLEKICSAHSSMSSQMELSY